MKSLILCLFLFVAYDSANAQIKAVTSNGDEVILNEDGTWKYLNEPEGALKTIAINPNKFQKSADAGFLVKSNNIACGIYINPKKWSFSKGSEGGATEYQLVLKGKDAYAMLITEKMEMPIETLKKAALSNAREVSPGMAIVEEEYRLVNGNKVLMMQMRGKVEGIDFTYFGYYFCSAVGTLQFLSYTSSNLMPEYKKEMEELLNGLVLTEDKK